MPGKCELCVFLLESEFWFQKFVPQPPGLSLDDINHGWEVVIRNSGEVVPIEVKNQICPQPSLLYHLTLGGILVVSGAVEA